MTKEFDYINIINNAFPELDLEDFKINDLGQNNNVIISKNIVFRFPKYDKGVNILRVECEVLNRIREKITIEIPYHKYINFNDNEVGKVFTGYKMIKGEPLLKDLFLQINNKELVGNQLSGFLKELHNIPKNLLQDLNIKEVDSFKEWTSFYDKIKNKLFKYMREDAIKEVTIKFENFLNNKDNFNFTKVLVHGDFGPSNILYDKKEKCISGIIDFAEVCFDDPAIDIASLIGPFGYGEEFVKNFKNIYPEVDTLLERAKFYRSTFALQEALFGIENDDEEAFKCGIEKYI